MRLILIHSWYSDMANCEDVYPIIHESPEAAYIDLYESYNKFRAEMDYIKF